MMHTIINRRIFFLLLFASISFGLFAQSQSNNLKELQKAWKFEAAMIDDPQLPVKFDLGNYYYKFYEELVFHPDSCLLKDSDKDDVVTYQVDDLFLRADLPTGRSIIAEWAIFKGKLYIEIETYHPYYDFTKSKLLLVYIPLDDKE